MPWNGTTGKKGKGKALVPPVLKPVDSEPAQKEVDKTTNVKPKKKKNCNGIYRAAEGRNHQLPHVVDIYQLRSHRGSIVIEIAQNIHQTIVTHPSRAHQSLMLVSERIGMYRNRSWTLIVMITSDRNGIANSIVILLSDRM